MQPPAVLLIDGDPDSLTIYSILLEHHGYRVLRASNGNDGLRQAEEEQPQLVVLEPFTPYRCEGGILEAFQANPATASIPLIVLTAIPGFLISGHAGIAADRLFTKPLQPRRLLSVVERILDQQMPTIPA